MRVREKSILAALFSLFILVPASAQEQNVKLTTVVLDAGHGGSDPGAVSRDGRVSEKNLTLAICEKVGARITEAYPEVTVIYTRTDDRFVTLDARAEIANRNQANLFISFHINSFETAAPDGFSTHIMGESSKKDVDLFAYNMNVCKRENSVILLEDDYSTTYQGFDPNDPESFIFFHLMQNAYYEQSLLFAADVNRQVSQDGLFRHDRGIHQDPFYVLWKTSMPAVLIESGFISNPDDLNFLTKEKGIDKIADSVFNAFSIFKERYDESTD